MPSDEASSTRAPQRSRSDHEPTAHETTGDTRSPHGGLRDRPAKLSEADAFSSIDYARAAADALLAADKTFTLGLFGDWGLGKTTILGGVGEIVRTAGFGFVNFDVWRFEGDALRRQFIREVAEQLKQGGHLPRRYNVARELRDLDVDIPVVSDRLRFSRWALMRATLLGATIGLLLWLYLRSSLPAKMFDREPQTSTAQEVSVLVAVATFAYGLLSQVLVVEPRVTTVQRIEEPERFYAKFVDLLGRAQTSRVVIAIDNLDHCSPDLVDEMLATIKTYLEPALDEAQTPGAIRRGMANLTFRSPRQVTDAVFVIAADDAGVRRHMIARELGKLPSSRRTPTTDLVDEAEGRVDEYLRKFFDASIRLRPILPEDIRTYARDQLDRLFAYVYAKAPPDAHPDDVLSNTEKERLVSLVVSALRRNPRRIKQFANSLETRLRTIEARERSGGIPRDQEISLDLLGVAKLAILEEEWRDFYTELEENPRRLAEAQTEVGRADLGNPRLSAFLRDTRDITPKNVSAVVNLKLESAEVTLPGYASFRDAVVYGELDRALEIIESDGEANRAEYAPRLPGMFADEVRRGGMAEGRNTLAAAFSDPPLGLEDEALIRRMLSDAVNNPSLLSQLPLMDPGRVFRAARLLDEHERRAARRPFLDLGTLGQQLGSEGVEAIAEQLAAFVGELQGEERQLLRNSFDVEPSGSQYRGSFLPLFRADPRLVSEAALQLSWQGLATQFDVTTPEFEVVTLGFEGGRGSGVVPQFVANLISTFERSLNESSLQRDTFHGVLTALDRVPRNRFDDLADLLASIRNNFGVMVAADPAAATSFGLQVMNIVLDHGVEDTADSTWNDELAQVIAENAPVQVAHALIDPNIPIADEVRLRVGERLEQLLPQYPDPEQRLPMLRAILTLDDGPARVATFLRSLITDTEIDLVPALLAPIARDLGGSLEDVLEGLYAFGRGSLEGARRSIIAVNAAIRAGALSPAKYFAERWEKLRTFQRSSLRKALVGLLDTEAEYVDEIAAIIAPVNLRSQDRDPLVRAFLRVAKNGVRAELRAGALIAATALATPSKPARQLVARARKDMLESEDETDREAARLATS
jgi:hypothetical protein